VVGPDGMPLLGKFAGRTGSIEWRGLSAPYARSRLWRRLHHKRWHYMGLSTADLFCAVAVVDLGWTNTAFAYAFDRRRGRVIETFSQNGIPGVTARVSESLAQGTSSHFSLLGKRIEFSQLPDRLHYRLALRCGRFEIDAELDASQAPPFLLAVGPVEQGAVHATQKSPGLPLRGTVQADGERFELAGGVGSIDYSNGLLARETAWRWASAHALGIGFNLQEGYFGQCENALWFEDRLVPLGAAHFDFRRGDSRGAWRIRTDDGLLDLTFQPQGERREDKSLLIAASRYVQPLGSFNGWVRPDPSGPAIEIEDLFGVTEDHYSRW
jgi:hypothetical protein